MLKLSARWFIPLLLVFSFLLHSCTDPEVIGLDLQPASAQPGISITDTFTINTYTVEEDSLVVWGPLKNLLEAPTLYCGSTDDPYVGKTFAGFVSQVRIGNTLSSTTFDVSTPDSIILSFNYKSIVGDSSATHHISVYELKDDLHSDSTYYSSRVFTKGDLLGHADLIPNLKDSSTVGAIKTVPQLRLALDTAFGGRLMRDCQSNTSNFASNTAFLSYFKGIVVVDSADGIGSIVTLPSTSLYHRMTIYFSGNKSYQFQMDVSAVRFSNFKHERLAFNNDTIPDNTLVVQSMGGLKDSIYIPYLKNLYKDGRVAINRADLAIKMNGTANTLGFKNHDNLLIFGSDSVGKNTSILDAFESSSYYGGAYNVATGEYHFNIARYVQNIVKGMNESGKKDYGLFIAAGGSTSNAQRTVLQGGSSMKLIVTYTKINP
ncbi:MAG: DUF4270 family protein [Bacteroidota bacterium]